MDIKESSNKDLLNLYFGEYKKSFREEAENYYNDLTWDRNGNADSFNTIFVWLSLYLNINIKQIKKIITDWKNDYSIDAIYIPNKDSIYNNIAVFDFKSNGSLNYEDINKFILYIEKYILDWKDLPIEWNDRLLERFKKLHSYIKTNPNTKIDIIIYRESLTNNSRKESEENRLQYLKSKYDNVWNMKILWKNDILWLLAKKLWYEWNIYAKDFSKFSLNYDEKNLIRIDSSILIWTVRLFDLLFFIKNIDEYNSSINSNNRKYDIFKLNVRKKTDKSKWIRTWIIETVKNEPENFLKYHNWITITCEDFKVNRDLIIFNQPQIVNWCQTISWLYENFKESLVEYENIIKNNNSNLKNKNEIIRVINDINKLKKARILVKIVVAKQLSNNPKKISQFANSQTEVEYKDLVSNNIEQLIISNYLSLNWFNYHRKEGQNLDKNKFTISMSLLYKFMYSYALLDPSRWKNELKNIFTDTIIYNSLFPNLFSLEDILKIANFYKSAISYIKRNNISKYYVDFIVFGLFLLYKEGGITKSIKPSSNKSLIDEILEERSWKKIDSFDRMDYMRYLQRLPWFVSKVLIESLEKKYNFTVDRVKFDKFRNLYRKKKLERTEKSIRKYIFYKWYNLDRLNNYLEEKEENWKEFKNLIWIIKDIVVDNNWKITKEDLFNIINKFKHYDRDYFESILKKNEDKIEEKDWYLFIV